MFQRTVSQQGSIISLFANGKWYYYDERSAPIGAGAMGVVYEGYSEDGREHVAIKRVIDKYANLPNIRERARTEASLMFLHRNLVEMIGCCEVYPDHGPIFIISHFVQGTNIDKFIRQIPTSPMRVKRICEMMYPILDALDYIHSKGIIHMDIKPSNIMVENGCNVRLMDLGIAYVDDHLVAGESTSATLMGTPKYAAPEQFGKVVRNVPLNKCTDIFEVGITLYELLTNQNPFGASNVLEAVEKRKTAVLPYNRNVPNAVIDVLRKATSFYQYTRYQSAREMKQALQEALAFKPRPRIPWMAIVITSVSVSVIIIIMIMLLWN